MASKCSKFDTLALRPRRSAEESECMRPPIYFGQDLFLASSAMRWEDEAYCGDVAFVQESFIPFKR